MRRLTALEEANRAPAPEAYDWRRRRGKFRTATESLRVQFVEVIRLPADYRGESHIEFVRALPDQDSQHRVEYREMPGPAPDRQRNNTGTTVLNIVFFSGGCDDGRRYG